MNMIITKKWIALLFGFLIPCNLYVFPWLENTPRITDLIGIFLLFCLGISFCLIRRVNIWVLSKALSVGVLVLPWLLNEWFYGVQSEVIMPLRWIIGILWGFVLWWIALDEDARYSLIIGLLAGVITNVIVLGIQSYGFMEFTQNIGLASKESTITTFRGVLRAPGIFGHPNASSAVVSLVMPIIIGLIDERKFKPHLVILGLLVLFLGSAFTVNRSSVIVSIIVFGVWIIIYNLENLKRLLGMSLLIITLAGIIFYVGPPGGWDRWIDEQNVSNNYGERIFTNIVALELISKDPLGIGTQYKELMMFETGHFTATHNAFLQLALLGGLPLAIIIFLRICTQFISLFFVRKTEYWIAFQLLGLFFFEEHFNNTTFIILTMWLMITSTAFKVIGKKLVILRNRGNHSLNSLSVKRMSYY